MNDAVREAARAEGVVVVGAGQAGGRLAEALRAGGFTGSLTLVGAEAHLPYERPSLSKEMLHDLSAETVEWVRPAEHYASEGIDLRLGVQAVLVDRSGRRVLLSDGTSVPYGVLVLATGGTPRRLSVSGGEAAITLRTLDDSRALRAAFRPELRLVVVGAGFIGLEVAAAARRHAVEVTVLEAADRAMARAVPPEISAVYAELHRTQGVDLRFGAGVERIESGTVHLRGGETLVADLVVAGIGTVPEDGLAVAAGLPTDTGIVVDEYGATADPFVFAAGDVARHFNPLLRRPVLLESWQNAQNQALAVARNLLGPPTPYAEVPWFWSDQYDNNLQIAGLPVPGGTTVERGSLASHRGTLFQLDGDGQLACAAGLNAARDVRVAKDLIALAARPDPAILADPATKLPDLLRALKRDKQAA